MSNIDKQAVTAKTKELASFMVERFSMNPVSCKLLNEAWEKEFPDEVAIAERMLALLDELEHYKSREERVTKLVLDNSTSWDALYKKLEAAEKRIAELDKRLIEYAGIATREAHRVAELEARKVNLSKLSVGEVMHMSGFSRDYAEYSVWPRR
ncbi:ead/Ea22-like family protein [Salmonella enterica]|nr:ead/Ea22-like family protein [Salmonella enterica]